MREKKVDETFRLIAIQRKYKKKLLRRPVALIGKGHQEKKISVWCAISIDCKAFRLYDCAKFFPPRFLRWDLLIWEARRCCWLLDNEKLLLQQVLDGCCITTAITHISTPLWLFAAHTHTYTFYHHHNNPGQCDDPARARPSNGRRRFSLTLIIPPPFQILAFNRWMISL